MVLPVLQKTWEIDANIAIADTQSSTNNKTLMFELVSSLVGFVNTPCTIWGSCNGAGGAGSFGNNDGINRWISVANLVWANPGSNHSWIVINFPGVGAKTSICIDLSVASTATEVCTIIMSPGAGFGLINGGLDGTATARPTATDEIALVNNTSWGGQVSWTAQKLHLWHSTDGQCTRIAVARQGNIALLAMIEKAKDISVPAWDGVVGVWVCTSANNGTISTYDNLFNNSASYKIRFSGTNYGLYPSVERCWALGSNNMNSFFTFPLDVFNEWPIFPLIGLWGSAIPVRVKFGNLYDFYYGAALLAVNGDSYPSACSNQFWQIGTVVLPGNGSALQVV